VSTQAIESGNAGETPLRFEQRTTACCGDDPQADCCGTTAQLCCNDEPQAIVGTCCGTTDVGTRSDTTVRLTSNPRARQGAAMNPGALPVAVIGGGPVGLAAAAHLLAKGETPIVFEAGASVGASVLSWGHVQLFSNWEYNIDPVSASLLQASGWQSPDRAAYPTGRQLVEHYMEPLANLPQMRPHLRLNTRVVAVTRQGFDKMKTVGRDEAPFVLVVRKANGREERVVAKAVIDASGTYAKPNPLGANGVPAVGEAALADRIFYGIPDVLGTHRKRYAERRVLVVGSGHSAFNAIADLVALAAELPSTQIVWAVRRTSIDHLFGGGENDQLSARGELGLRVRRLVEQGAMQLVSGFRLQGLDVTDDGIHAIGEREALPPVDEIIATTGFRPDLSFLQEVRLRLDPAVESPEVLAPLIDPNFHSCGTVRPHGVDELSHPDKDFFLVGMKSYGRAPTFLLRTGYEQVRSVVSALVGDWESARSVELVLPETGVCSGTGGTASCAVPVVTLALEGVGTFAGGRANGPMDLQLVDARPAGAGCCG
jgi:thioredoxin reductase